MAEVVHIADIKQRVVATKAKLSAASQEGLKVNARLLDLLEAVEKTLLYNQGQIRRLKRTGKALALFCFLSWIATAALIAERFFSDTMNDVLDGALLGSQPGTTPAGAALTELETTDTAADHTSSESVADSRETDRAAMGLAKTAEAPQIGAPASGKPKSLVQDVDDLVFKPHDFQGRQVVVTGSVVRLFRRYRLRSETGQNTIVIDVDGLRPADREELEAAIEEAGLLGDVRARIMGRVERQKLATFHLAASEMVLLDSPVRPVRLGRDRQG